MAYPWIRFLMDQEIQATVSPSYYTTQSKGKRVVVLTDLADRWGGKILLISFFLQEMEYFQ